MGNVFTVQQRKSPYPRYLYHKDYNEPIRVDSAEDEAPLLNQGWVAKYLHKEYPKWVNGIIVQDAEGEAKALENGPKDNGRTVLKTNDEKSYACDICGEIFKHPWEKAQHVRKTGHQKLTPTVHKAKQTNGKENPKPEFKE